MAAASQCQDTTSAIRGEWMELDQNKMQQLLEFWQSHAQEQPEMTLLDLMKLAAESEEELEVDP